MVPHPPPLDRRYVQGRGPVFLSGIDVRATVHQPRDHSWQEQRRREVQKGPAVGGIFEIDQVRMTLQDRERAILVTCVHCPP